MSPGGYASYADIYRTGPLAHMPNEVRLAGSWGASLVRARQPLHDVAEPATPDLSLSLLVRGDVDVRRDLGDGLRRDGDRRGVPGDMLLSPHGTDVPWRVDAPHEVLILGVPFARAAGLLDEAVAPGAAARLYRACRTVIRDPVLEAALHGLWREAARPDAVGALFVDQATVLLLAGLARLSGQGWPRGHGRAAPRRFARAAAFVEAHLADDVSLADLAAAAALSPRQVLRAFRAETGATPHAYLQRRRVERAKELLARSDLPLVDVAHACGFKGQSHFGQAFRRLAGATPGAYRRERRR